MARDRQRSKARKRARAAQQDGSRPPGKQSRARDAGIDDPQVDEQGLTDAVPAPDPLKNATPDADQARAAETGATRPEPAEEIDVSDDDDFGGDVERAPDEMELPPDLVAGGGGRGGRGGGLQTLEDEVPDQPRKDRGKVVTFLRGCVDELRRVQWPDRKQVGQATAVVLGFVAIAGLFLGAMDALFQPLIEAIL